MIQCKFFCTAIYRQQWKRNLYIQSALIEHDKGILQYFEVPVKNHCDKIIVLGVDTCTEIICSPNFVIFHQCPFNTLYLRVYWIILIPSALYICERNVPRPPAKMKNLRTVSVLIYNLQPSAMPTMLLSHIKCFSVVHAQRKRPNLTMKWIFNIFFIRK